jgi:glycosyltransferase involved in cell wall biosynthesis
MSLTLTVITVCYNAPPEHVARTLESVREQVMCDIQHIVVDGGSCDDTLAAIHQYGVHLALLISEPDNGIFDAMNKGIGLAENDVVLFLNMNDSFHGNQAARRALDHIERECSDILYCDVDRSPWEPARFPWRLTAAFLCNVGLCHQGIFARTSIFKNVGSFDTTYRIWADNEWLLRAFDAGYQFRYASDIVTEMPPGGFTDQNSGVFESERRRLIENRLSKFDQLTFKVYWFGARLIRRIKSRNFHIPPSLSMKIKSLRKL